MNTNTILILHGWGSCAKNWVKVKELLEAQGCEVFVPDLPGFGENPPLEKSWSIEDYVQWLKEYCGTNSLAQFFLAGHSFGGNIAAQYALKFPQDIKKLILVDPAIVRVKDAKRELMAKIAKLIKKLSFLPFYSLARRAFYRFLVKSDYPDTEGPMRETYLKTIKRDFSSSLPDISVPTTLIWGEADDITPFKYARLIKDKIAGAKLEILPGIHHSPQIEAPELLVEKIVNFIKA